jgi:hypothetical protein
MIEPVWILVSPQSGHPSSCPSPARGEGTVPSIWRYPLTQFPIKLGEKKTDSKENEFPSSPWTGEDRGEGDLVENCVAYCPVYV